MLTHYQVLTRNPVLSIPGHQASTSRTLTWIQCKLGKHIKGDVVQKMMPDLFEKDFLCSDVLNSYATLCERPQFSIAVNLTLSFQKNQLNSAQNSIF